MNKAAWGSGRKGTTPGVGDAGVSLGLSWKDGSMAGLELVNVVEDGELELKLKDVIFGE